MLIGFRYGIFILLFASIAGAFVFGAYFMHHDPGHGVGCFAAAMTDTFCPEAARMVQHLLRHIETLRNLSLGLVKYAAQALFLAFAALALFSRRTLQPSREELRAYSSSAPDAAIVLPGFLHWLALHEKRDPALPA